MRKEAIMAKLPDGLVVHLKDDTRRARIVIAEVDELVTCARCKHYIDDYGYCGKFELGGFLPSDFCSKSAEK